MKEEESGSAFKLFHSTLPGLNFPGLNKEEPSSDSETSEEPETETTQEAGVR